MFGRQRGCNSKDFDSFARFGTDGRGTGEKSKCPAGTNLFVCFKCQSDVKTEKVVIYDMANILCFSCRSKMQDEIMDIAKRYLR